jgi:hypothetical protein
MANRFNLSNSLLSQNTGAYGFAPVATPTFAPGPASGFNRQRLASRLAMIENPFARPNTTPEQRTAALARIQPFLRTSDLASRLGQLEEQYKQQKEADGSASLGAIVTLSQIQKVRQELGLPEFVGGRKRKTRKARGRSRKSRR